MSCSLLGRKLGRVMADLQKGLMVLLVAGFIGYAGFAMLDIEYLSQSPTAVTKAGSADVSEKDLQAIMDGEDPTEVLEPTAAGKPLNYICDTGYIAGDMDKNRFSKISYASIAHEGKTYIQISRYSPTYLIQENYQIVSATEVRDIPAEIKNMLDRKIKNPAECDQQDLYLSNIRHLK